MGNRSILRLSTGALCLGLPILCGAASAAAVSVVATGSFQSELGCGSDFQPDCTISALLYDTTDDVWQRVLNLPGGSYSYIAALNGSFTESYGLHARPGGANIPLAVPRVSDVKFYYDDKSHWMTDNLNSISPVLAGSFQSELGCGSDFDPSCLRSWLQDPDGDGIYTYASVLPIGSYSTIVAINESFDDRYGAGGLFEGENIDFLVGNNAPVTFRYDGGTHVLTIDDGTIPATVPIPGSLLLMATACAGFAMAGRRKV